MFSYQVNAKAHDSDWTLFCCGLVRHLFHVQVGVVADETKGLGEQWNNSLPCLCHYIPPHLFRAEVPGVLNHTNRHVANLKTAIRHKGTHLIARSAPRNEPAVPFTITHIYISKPQIWLFITVQYKELVSYIDNVMIAFKEL